MDSQATAETATATQPRYYSEAKDRDWLIRDRQQNNKVVYRQFGGKEPLFALDQLNTLGYIEDLS